MQIFANSLPDNPTPKFGIALRAQVEERLAFFETGAPPSKNADAIKKVLDELAADEADADEDVEMGDAFTTLQAEPSKKVKEKKKKRKSDAMDVDEDEDEEPETKKVKLSKEEKKALKKAKKAKAKEDGVVVSFCYSFPSLTFQCSLPSPRTTMHPKRRRRRKRRKKTSQKRRRRRKRRTRESDILFFPYFAALCIYIFLLSCSRLQYFACRRSRGSPTSHVDQDDHILPFVSGLLLCIPGDNSH